VGRSEDWQAGFALLDLCPVLAQDAARFTRWANAGGRFASTGEGDHEVVVFNPNPLMDWDGQYGVEPGARPPVLHAVKRGAAGAEGMAPDHRTAWQVRFSQPRPPEIRLKITAIQEEFTWDVTVPVKTPTEPNVW